MIPELTTERLLLRPLELADAAAIQVLFPVWGVVEYLEKKFPWPYPEDGALRFVRDVTLPAMAGGEEWLWTLRLKSAPEELIGCISLRPGEANRGFWLGVPWQRQGLMTEAAEVVTEFWFASLGMEKMRVPKAVGNLGSRRISERQGMRVVAVGEKEFVCGVRACEIWEITAEEWKARVTGSCRG